MSIETDNARILQALAAADPVLGGVIAAVGPLRLQPDLGTSPFEHLATAIANQQISGVVADRILARLRTSFAPAATADAGAATATTATTASVPFPSPEQILAADPERLRAVGFSYAKVAALQDLAAKAVTGVVPDVATLQRLDDEAIIERLIVVRGVGRWTVQMMLIFQLGRPDVLPIDDFGVQKGFQLAYGLRSMPRPRALAAFAARWAPWRSAASWYMWRVLDLAKAGRVPEPPRPAPRLRVPARRRRRLRRAT